MGIRSINDYSIAELEQLIARKKEEEAKAPSPLEKPDFTGVIRVVKEYIAEIERGDEPKDIKHWIYEACVDAVYGDRIWDWINKRH